MVDSSGLENRYSSKQRTIEGSNPPLSFFLANEFFYFIYFRLPRFFRARLYHHLAEPKKRLDINELKNQIFFQ